MAKTTTRIEGAPDLVGAKEIADALKCSVRTMWRWVKKGMPVTTWLGKIAAYSDQILAWRQAHGEAKRAA